MTGPLISFIQTETLSFGLKTWPHLTLPWHQQPGTVMGSYLMQVIVPEPVKRGTILAPIGVLFCLFACFSEGFFFVCLFGWLVGWFFAFFS